MYTLKAMQSYIDRGLVRVTKHATLDWYIYNYTSKVQYNRAWDAVTLASRGLILTGDGEVIARPFPKFFNLGEMENQAIPNEPFEVYDKLDGSLGILYWQESEPFIATRASFQSEQALFATQVLKSKYPSVIPKLDKTKTYLFEIIYPENRIVVDYEGLEDIILIGIVDNATGKEEALVDIGFPMVQRFDGLNDIHTLQALATSNKEGFVIKYASGFRVKVKFEEYVRLHKVLTNLSKLSVWEALSNGEDFMVLLEQVPDEYYQWARATKSAFETKYAELEAKAKQDFKVLATRKETAMYFMTCEHPSILFHMLDEKPYEPVIWKYLKPKYEKLHVERGTLS